MAATTQEVLIGVKKALAQITGSPDYNFDIADNVFETFESNRASNERPRLEFGPTQAPDLTTMPCNLYMVNLRLMIFGYADGSQSDRNKATTKLDGAWEQAHGLQEDIIKALSLRPQLQTSGVIGVNVTRTSVPKGIAMRDKPACAVEVMIRYEALRSAV